MKKTLRWILNVGLALTSGFTGLSHTASATSSETSPAITIYVHNYAGVSPKTLTEAEDVATGIFRKAGLEARWVDTGPNAEKNAVNSNEHPALTLADIQLSILSRKMSDRFGLPNNVMGLAPGMGPDREMVYVSGSRVDAFYWKMLSAHGNGPTAPQVSKAQILGHAIAHEVGHLLLNLQVHSERGIMRGEWGPAEMWDAAYGMLLFTPEQAELLRADVRRRSEKQNTLEAD